MPFNSRKSDRHVIAADIRVTDERGNRTDLVAVDMSRTGLGTDGLIQLKAGQSVTIELPDGTVKHGSTVWREDFSGGLLFDQEMTEQELHRTMRSLASRQQF
ncbi:MULTISPECIES: hypothetical protein [Sphingomonas]|uniref:PilZ domain-containing protein n=1 Tax=Sphingomonas kyungheensis TaxID=1069987 RepID=A0ABU8H6Q3_9SPHN|nr:MULTISPECIES: hypothetical protein [unclassified Sphingomonas]EZP54337.1 hypothetical protein BW41_01651 [Sphingomonas sp. RIT328]